MDARVTELVKAARAAEYWSSHGTHGDGRQAEADARLARARRAVESALAAAPGEAGIRKLSRPRVPATGDRVAILWLAGDGEADGATMDLCTVVEAGEYTMLVRVGWQGREPLLMSFRASVFEETAWQGEGMVGLVRESAGIPTNWRD